MNCKEHHLPELELATGQVREALKAILHTILFIRSPGPVAPLDVHCENFNLTYSRIAGGSNGSSSGGSSSSSSARNKNNQNHYLDKKVDAGIEEFLNSLVQIGPELLSVSTACRTRLYFELTWFYHIHSTCSSNATQRDLSNINIIGLPYDELLREESIKTTIRTCVA